MKKLFFTLAILLIASKAFAACIGVDGGIQRHGGGIYSVEWTITADTTPGTCTVDATSTIMDKIGGMYILDVSVRPGGTAPDAASLAIEDSIGKSYLKAAGNGLNLIHATSTLWTYMDGNTDSLNCNPSIWSTRSGNRPLKFTATGQATNNAVFIVEIQFAEEKQ